MIHSHLSCEGAGALYKGENLAVERGGQSGLDFRVE